MLVQLSVSNFAIIKRLDLALRSGLNILSGETGAGKSIVINAINLVLGGRASSDLIRTGSQEARVEALFSFPEKTGLSAVLEELGIPFDGELLIQRTIFKEGRNRIHINGVMATLQMLSGLGAGLISISGQHEHQSLLRPERHLSLLDEFAGLSQEREALAGSVKLVQSLREDIRVLAKEIEEAEVRRELEQFQIQEIERACLRPGEDGDLESERRRLQHAGQLLEISSEGYEALYEGEGSALSLVSQWARRMEKAAEVDPRLGPIRTALADIGARIEDAGLSLRDFRNDIDLDPLRLEQVEERLELLKGLKRKYGGTVEEVLALKDGLASRMEASADQKARLQELEAGLAEAAGALLAMAAALSRKRKQAAGAMEKAVEMELEQLHMAETRFQVRLQTPDLDGAAPVAERIALIRPDGMDRTEFMISPNVGEALRPLSKIASGGELSRVMLALKTILSRTASVETVIFDEVDAGIGGATAEVVGEKLLRLGGHQQVICITHLPQIASQGSAHFLVRKEVEDGRTQTAVLELGPEERVEEIARLLGGREITLRALAHAREMLARSPA